MRRAIAIPYSKKVNYWNFGFIPNGLLRQDIRGKLFGHPNLLKRLQAREIMDALDLQPADVALDFGCGAGFFTVEMAKLARKAYGIDTNPYVREIKIPTGLQGRLEYIQAPGEKLPFEADHFDKILASEILPMIPDPGDFLREIRRVLKPDGRLVIVNGAGHPALRSAWARPGVLFRWARWCYAERMPASYEDYCAILQTSFRTSQGRFFGEDDIRAMLEHNGFRSLQFCYTPGFLFGLYFSWSQLFRYLRSGRTVSQRNFLFPYYLFSLIRPFERRGFPGGLLCMAQK